MSDPALLVMVHRLDTGAIQVTVLNFSTHSVRDRVVSEHFVPGAAVTDMSTGRGLGMVDDANGLQVALGPHQGRSLLLAVGSEADRVMAEPDPRPHR